MRRTFFNNYERMVIDDFNNAQLLSYKALNDELLYNLCGRQASAFVGQSFLVDRVSATSVSLRPGRGYMTVTASGDTPTFQPMQLDTTLTQAIAAGDPTNPRIDIISVKPNEVTDTSETRDLKTGGVGPIAATSVVKKKKYTYSIVVTQGTPAGSPATPSTPSGYVKIATITVSAGATGVANQAAITDNRLVVDLGPYVFNKTNYINYLSNASADGAGWVVYNPSGTNGSLKYDATLPSKWKGGLLGSEVEFVNITATQTVSNKTHVSCVDQSAAGSARNYLIDHTGQQNGTTGSFIIPITADRAWTLPDTTGTLALLGLAQTWSAEQTFSAQMRVSNGSVTEPSISWTSDDDATGLGLYRIGANNLGFAANGVKVGEYLSSGAWVIGNTSVNTNHIIQANPTSGYMLKLANTNSTNGQSSGLWVNAGNGNSDYTQIWTTYAGGFLCGIRGDGKAALDSGAIIAGDTSATAIAAGKIGEILPFTGNFVMTASATSSGTVHSSGLTAGKWMFFVNTWFSNGGTIFAPSVDVYINGSNSTTFAYDHMPDQRAQASSLNFPGPSFTLSSFQSSGTTSIQLRVASGAMVGTCSIYYSIQCLRVG